MRFISNIMSNKALSSVLAIVLGMSIGFAVLLATSPSNAVPGFVSILRGGLGNMRDAGQVLFFATPIIMTGLSVGFSMKTGLFNIGASGQFIVGAFAGIFVGVRFEWLGTPWHWMAGILAAAICGALWGLIPGLLKAYRNVHEVISTIMMNYIGMFLVNHTIIQTIHDTTRNQTMRVPASGNVPRAGLDEIFRSGHFASSVNGGIFIALGIAVIAYIIIDKTTLGYELRACGLNQHAAKYAGINTQKSIILSMMISGAFAGVGGALLYLSGAGNGIDVVDILADEGFQGIVVALLGLANPIGIIFSGIFVAHLHVGGFNMQLYGFPSEVIDLILAIIIYFSAFALIIRGFIQNLLLRRKVSKPTARTTEGGAE